jgi:hypothetical protein
MKNSIKTLSLLVAVAAGTFTSCIDDVIDTNPPVISITSPLADTVEVVIGETVDFVLDLSSGNDLVSFQALTSNSGVELTNGSQSFTGITEQAIIVNATLTEAVVAGTVIEINFILADAQKQTTAKKYILAKANTTPLSEAKDFKWERVGGTAATGLDQFGLTWTSNTGTSAVIKKGADKFVELNPEDWTSFTTLEDIVAAIDAATDMDRWEKISAQASQSYDLTLGTIKDSKYYLIHVVDGKVTTDATVGTTIVISGQYKE